MGEVTDGDIEKIGQMMLGTRTEQLETAEGESSHD